MESRIDELSQEDHINMRKVEFYEAIARVADRAGEAAGLDEIVENSLRMITQIKEKRNPVQGSGSIVLGAPTSGQSPMMPDPPRKRNANHGKANLKAGQKALAHKIYALIHKMALQCMGQDYAEKYMRARQEEKLIVKMFVDEDILLL